MNKEQTNDLAMRIRRTLDMDTLVSTAHEYGAALIGAEDVLTARYAITAADLKAALTRLAEGLDMGAVIESDGEWFFTVPDWDAVYDAPGLSIADEDTLIERYVQFRLTEEWRLTDDGTTGTMLVCRFCDRAIAFADRGAALAFLHSGAECRCADPTPIPDQGWVVAGHLAV